MEKILLLKESLRGRAQTVIKGIKLIPSNYNWIIETLKETYCDQTTNRSQIVQKLVNLRPANDTAESCSSIFDQIKMLTNQMISAGYDVRSTCDPMWGETILAKFPRDIVKPILIASQTQSKQTIDDLMALLKKEIAAKGYVEGRLGPRNFGKAETTKDKHIKMKPHTKEGCLFCHKPNHFSMQCRTVSDQSSRRNILKENNRCWKCSSANHSSYDCESKIAPFATKNTIPAYV